MFQLWSHCEHLGLGRNACSCSLTRGPVDLQAARGNQETQVRGSRHLQEPVKAVLAVAAGTRRAERANVRRPGNAPPGAHRAVGALDKLVVVADGFGVRRSHHR